MAQSPTNPCCMVPMLTNMSKSFVGGGGGGVTLKNNWLHGCKTGGEVGRVLDP